MRISTMRTASTPRPQGRCLRFARRSGHASRRGSSLLEVAAATMMTSLVVLPTMDLVIQSGRVSQRLLIAGVLENQCASLLSQRQAELQAQFAATTTFGTLDVSGIEDFDGAALRFETEASDSSGLGGILNQLLVLRVTVWWDSNRDGKRGEGEASRELWSMIARRSNG